MRFEKSNFLLASVIGEEHVYVQSLNNNELVLERFIVSLPEQKLCDLYASKFNNNFQLKKKTLRAKVCN